MTPNSWVTIKTDNVLDSLKAKYERFPEHGRLYCGQISEKNDVTPRCEEDITALLSMTGDFWVVEYPAGYELLYYAAIALIAVVAIVAISGATKIPTATNRNYQSASPNNALSGRSNQARINNRIPDIYGTLRSTPDLLAVPYSIFNNHVEFEYTYMCIGRGFYSIPEDGVRDGQTLVSNIEGESIEVFGPNTSPNSGDDPELRIGTAITRQVISAVRSKSVNGQTLTAINEAENVKSYDSQISFTFPNKINSIPGNPVYFVTDYNTGDDIVVTTSPVFCGFNDAGIELAGTHAVQFAAAGYILLSPGLLASLPHNGGEFIQLVDAIVSDGSFDHDFSGKYRVASISGDELYLVNPGDTATGWGEISAAWGSLSAVADITFAETTSLYIDLSGLYHVTSVDDVYITLDYPANTQAAKGNWSWMPGLDYNGTDYSWGVSGSTVTIGQSLGVDNWVGPFILDVTTTDEIITNFVAVNGMYKDDGTVQTATSVTLQIGVTPCTKTGVPTDVESYYNVTVEGSADVQSQRAATLFAPLQTSSRVKVRARRLTSKLTSFVGSVVDEVKWRDLYSSSSVDVPHFGDITTVHSITQATQQALAVQDRQLNLLVSRKLPVFYTDHFGPDLAVSNRASDIIAAICLDPKLGNRPFEEMDFDNIYSTVLDVIDYFGIDVAGEFSYTFDSDNLSFEEMLTIVTSAVFCKAQRRGRVIELSFEKQTEDSVLLFNHRNKLPGSETRTTQFGARNNNDGIEYDYVSPDDDAIVTFYIPEDQTAVNPIKIESVGVRSIEQAYLHAYREYNKLLYQVRSVEFVATQEAEILSINSKVLIADNTRPDIQDGEIRGQNGLILRLSQPCVMQVDVDYVICLQEPSGIIEIKEITATTDPYSVLLTSAPAEVLSLADDASVKCIYQIVKESDVNKGNNRGFLITEKKPQGNFTTQITAINYDDLYYQNDLNFHA